MSLLMASRRVTTGAPASPYSAAVLADSPIGYWRLGDAVGATTVLDSSGNTRNGTAIAGATMPTFGTTGLLAGDANTAASFDGGDRIDVADNAAWDVTSFSVEAVVKSSGASIAMVLARHSTGVGCFEFGMTTTGQVRLQIINGSGVLATGIISVFDGVKHHIAATYDGANMRVYVDGAADGVTATATNPAVGSDTLSIGYRASSGLANFTGVIDEVAIYNTALSAARVLAHASAI